MDEPLKGFKEAVEEFTRTALRPYLQRLKDGHQRQQLTPKLINDAIWGTIEVDPWAVAMLDSPLHQRLRRVRQLGGVHFVFPSATHTRLEHSLGVYHQVREITGKLLKDHLPRLGAEAGDPAWAGSEKGLRTALALAALSHDVGHGAMSHVMEYHLRDVDDVQELCQQFSAWLRENDGFGDVEDKKPSEIAAYFMVGAPAFIELTQVALSIGGHEPIPDCTTIMQKAIVGLEIHPRYPYLHELVSGPMDGDKLDYLQRDSQMAGVPSVTDIRRLHQKIVGKRWPFSDLPRTVRDRLNVKDGAVLVHGLQWSGARAYDELSLARTLLFDKIYQHSKTRAVEAMVGTLNDLVTGDAGPIQRLLATYNTVDDAWLSLESIEDVSRVRAQIGLSQDKGRATLAVEMARRLRERELLVRAYAIPKSLGDKMQSHAEANALAQLLGRFLTIDSRQRFLDEVRERIRLMNAKLPVSERANEVGLDFICLDPIRSGKTEGPTPSILLFQRDKVVEDDRGQHGAKGVSDAIISQRSMALIFAPRDLVELTYLSCEQLLFEKHELRGLPGINQNVKPTEAALNAYRKHLKKAGYYTGALQALEPDPDWMVSGGLFENAVFDIREALAGHMGPLALDQDREDRVEQTAIRRELVRIWLKQWPEDIAKQWLTILPKIRMIGRVDIYEALESAISVFTIDRARICRLGSSKDSSSIVVYWARQITGRHPDIKPGEIDDAIRGPDPIIFVDDFIGSGEQSVAILRGMLGDKHESDLHEERSHPIPKELVESFKAKELFFVFAAGETRGKENLEKNLRALGLRGHVYIHIEEDHLPKLSASKTFIDEVKRVGLQLAKAVSPKRKDDELVQRTLGYGNKGFLVAFPYNTPAQTVTALWADGIVDGKRWMPLVARLKKE